MSFRFTRKSALIAAGAALALVAGSAWIARPDRGPRYTPAYRFGQGSEVVMVFLGSAHCRASTEAGFPEVFERAKLAASRRARAEGKQFRVIGVAIDDHPEEGWKFLRRFGDFDEISLGGNWMNHDVVRYVWRDLPYRPSLPQVLVVERELKPGPDVVWVSQERELRRLLGTDEIRRWEEAGAPFTGALPRAAPPPAS